MHITQKAHNEILQSATKAKENNPYIRINVAYEHDARLISASFTSPLYVNSRKDVIEKHERYTFVMTSEVASILADATLDAKNGSIFVKWSDQS